MLESFSLECQNVASEIYKSQFETFFRLSRKISVKLSFKVSITNMGGNLKKLIINNHSYSNNCPFRPVKRGQVRDIVFKRLLNIYQRGQSSLDIEEIPVNIEVFYVIVDFFVLDVCSKPIFCSKIAQKDKQLFEVSRTAKSYSKRQKLLKSCRAHRDRHGPS